MKKLFALLLSVAMLLSMVACAGGEVAGEPEVSQTAEMTEAVEAPATDVEIERAISLGLVPENIQGEYEQVITFEEYTEMLTRLITRWDGSKLPQWQEITAQAAKSQEPMKWEDGLVEIGFAMVLLEQNEPSEFTYFDQVTAELAEGTPNFTWDYPLFPNWEDEDFSWCGSSYPMGTVLTCGVNYSAASCQPIFPYDSDMDMTAPLRRGDAIRSVLRLGETVPEVFEAEPVYISVKDVGHYDETVITDELLNRDSDLPEPTQQKLPSEWKGIGLSNIKHMGCIMRDFPESDIILLAENGFNFTKLFFGFSTLRYPDYPEDMNLINENELKDLDQLLAWCIEYDVHLSISLFDMPWQSNDHWGLGVEEELLQYFEDYWLALARRYADIPAKYLSFDLVNEIEPGDEYMDQGVACMERVAQGIWEISPQRVLLCSYMGDPSEEWLERMAEIGLAIGCHPYYPEYISGVDGWYQDEFDPFIQPTWPQIWMPMDVVDGGQVPLTLIAGEQGVLDGKLSIFHNAVYGDAFFEIYADGKLLYTLQPYGEDETCYTQLSRGTLLTVDIPENTQKLEIMVRDGAIKVQSVFAGDGKTAVVNHGEGTSEGIEMLPIVVNGDGSWDNTEGWRVTAQDAYDKKIAPMLAVAEKYNVGFMCNEWGIYSTNVAWDIDVVTAYHDDFATMLEEHNIPWCHCELYNGVPKHSVTMMGEDTQWVGDTMVQETYGGKTYTISRELFDGIRKFTRK